MSDPAKSPRPTTRIFSLESGRHLRDRICERLGLEPGNHEERTFEDGEHKIRPLESVRGRDVYVVQSLYGGDDLSVNDKLVRVLTLLGALRDAGADRLTLVAPYLCYARKDMRTKSRDPVTTRYIALLLESVGIDRIATVEVHNPAAFENAFRVPTEHLTPTRLHVERFEPLIGSRDVVVVSPDAGGTKRAERFRAALEERLGRSVGSAYVEKFRSEGVVRGGALVGDVEDRVAIILDDLISSGTTLARAASACREEGAYRVYAAATHGVFSPGAEQILSDSQIDRICILDTIPLHRIGSELLRQRFDVVHCAPLLAEAIYRLHTDGSIVSLLTSPKPST